MSNVTDFHSIDIDVNGSPVINNRDVDDPFRTETMDYGAFIRRLAGVNTPSVPLTVICIAFDLIFTLIGLVIGGSNVDSCPIERRIPIYLIVISTVNLFSIFLTIIALLVHIKEKDQAMCGYFLVIGSSIFIIVLQIFNFIWMIVGSVWVFGVFPFVQYKDINGKNYCQVNLYQYAFISIILQYIIPFVMCCCKNLPLKK